MTDPQQLPDLANRALAGAVVAANDEFFAAKENLVLPHPPVARTEFGHRGKEYDGWETRRRRSPGHDWAIVRLGAPGIVAGVVVDTSYFAGNYPPQASLEEAAVEGYGNAPGAAALTGRTADGEDVELLPRTRLQPDTPHCFLLPAAPGVVGVRLDVFPDGGMARLRLCGRPTAAGRAQLGRRWFDALPDVQAMEVLGSLHVNPAEAGRLVAGRPVSGDLPPAVRTLLDGPA